MDETLEYEQHVSTDIGAFAMIPLWYLETHPSGRAVHCLSVLLAKFADRHTNQCWPTRQTIGDLMGCSPSTVDRAIEELREAGIVSTSGRVREDGSQTSNTYSIRLARPTCAKVVPQNWSTASSDLHSRSSRFDQPITRTSEPESINQKAESHMPVRTELTTEFKEAMRREWSPKLKDFEESWNFIRNSKYLLSKPDKQAYVIGQLKRNAQRDSERTNSRSASKPPAQPTASKPSPFANIRVETIGL